MKPEILQYAWVVPKLEDAIHHWHALFGIGPFLVNRDIQLGDPRYRGAPSTTRFSTAVAQHGSAQIELIEQLDDGPSAYRDLVPAGRTGFHHVALIPADYDAGLARYQADGFAIAADGRFGDLRFAYIDTSPAIGAMTELLEDKPTIRAFFGAIRKAAERWDGDVKGLVREL